MVFAISIAQFVAGFKSINYREHGVTFELVPLENFISQGIAVDTYQQPRHDLRILVPAFFNEPGFAQFVLEVNLNDLYTDNSTGIFHMFGIDE